MNLQNKKRRESLKALGSKKIEKKQLEPGRRRPSFFDRRKSFMKLALPQNKMMEKLT